MEKKDEEKVVKVLGEELSKIVNMDEMALMMKILLTETERLMIGKRIFAFVMINKGSSDTEIARRLHFTRATVERLRIRFIHQEEINQPVKKLVNQLETSQMLKDLLKEFLRYAIPVMGGRIPR